TRCLPSGRQRPLARTLDRKAATWLKPGCRDSARGWRGHRHSRALLDDAAVDAGDADDELVRTGRLRARVPVVGVRRLRRCRAQNAVDEEVALLHRAARVDEPVL